jgi:hypothetical protein
VRTAAAYLANRITLAEGWTVSSPMPGGNRFAGQARDTPFQMISGHQKITTFYSSLTAGTSGITSTRRYCPPITKIPSKRMTTETNNAPLIPPERYIEAGATVCNSPALLLSKILRSPNVSTVLSNAPSWVDRADLHAQVAAIHRAAAAWKSRSTALEREDADVVGAVMPESAPGWTTKRAADHLGMSQRRVQELAPELGGTRLGREWRIPEVAVHREYEKRRQRTA